MRPEIKRAIMRAGYAVLAALLALVFYIVWDGTQHPTGESLSLFSGRRLSAVAIACLAVGIVAGAAAVFFVIRAFYIGFSRRGLGRNNDS